MKPLMLFAALSLAACVSAPPLANTGPSAALNQTAIVNGLRIRPISVIEDSRCPAQVQCVWAGRLVVRARMTGDGWTQIRDFELGMFQAVDRYRVTLVRAEPPKAAPGKIDPRAYRFTFDVLQAS